LAANVIFRHLKVTAMITFQIFIAVGFNRREPPEKLRALVKFRQAKNAAYVIILYFSPTPKNKKQFSG